jgi:hypothetical protein
MNEKTKAAVEASVELFKGFVRPLVVLYMTAIVGVMTYQQTINSIPEVWWWIYGGFAGEWLTERTIKRLSEIKK